MTGTVPFFHPESGCGFWRGGSHVTTLKESLENHRDVSPAINELLNQSQQELTSRLFVM